MVVEVLVLAKELVKIVGNSATELFKTVSGALVVVTCLHFLVQESIWVIGKLTVIITSHQIDQ